MADNFAFADQLYYLSDEPPRAEQVREHFQVQIDWANPQPSRVPCFSRREPDFSACISDAEHRASDDFPAGGE